MERQNEIIEEVRNKNSFILLMEKVKKKKSICRKEKKLSQTPDKVLLSVFSWVSYLDS